MVFDADDLVADFGAAAAGFLAGLPCDIRTETLPAPHRPAALPFGHGAVYLFRLSELAGARCGAGVRKVLKVGSVGANSNPRFQFQHYSPNSAGSNLAKSLLGHRILWPWLGIEGLTEANIKQWMLTNLERVHFFVPSSAANTVLRPLEVYVRARVGSVFEGSA